MFDAARRATGWAHRRDLAVVTVLNAVGPDPPPESASEGLAPQVVNSRGEHEGMDRPDRPLVPRQESGWGTTRERAAIRQVRLPRGRRLGTGGGVRPARRGAREPNTAVILVGRTMSRSCLGGAQGDPLLGTLT